MLAGCFGRDEKINVADGLSPAPHKLPAVLQRMTSGCCRKLSRIGSKYGECVVEDACVANTAGDARCLRAISSVFSPKPSSSARPCRPCRRLRAFDGIHAQMFVEGDDLLRAEAGNFQHRDHASRDGGFEFVVILEFPGGDEFGDFLLERVANALSSPRRSSATSFAAAHSSLR